MIAVQRGLELGGRLILLAGKRRSAWWIGTTSLSLAKILENMEIGHNVLHGQWDWMRDPKIHSSTWDWDHSSPPEQWKRAHNETHHKYTNIVGKDNDLGYGIMRVAEEQPWQPRHLAQPCGTSSPRASSSRASRCTTPTSARRSAARGACRTRPRSGCAALRKAGKQAAKDYVVHPALSGRGFRRTLAANAVANLARNVWSHSVIMCGHFPEGVETFELEVLDDNETKGEWYVRQMLGSADISGSPFMHLMTGNLSHQIEHHCFPDLPSNRYGEIAPQVEDLFQRYGLSYNTRPLVRQVGSAWHRVLRLSFPDGWLEETNRRNVGSQLKKLARRTPQGRRERGARSTSPRIRTS